MKPAAVAQVRARCSAAHQNLMAAIDYLDNIEKDERADIVTDALRIAAEFVAELERPTLSDEGIIEDSEIRLSGTAKRANGCHG